MSGFSRLVGAVAYHPRVVTIWESFREYFDGAGVPIDYVLYSSYERLVAALLNRDVDIAWNTNTAYVAAEEAIGGNALLLGMRDVDADYRSLVVVRRGEGVENPAQLNGRRMALGSRDSGHAAILPVYFLGRAGMKLDESLLLRFDTDMGKHGDTGHSELRVVEAVAAGRADAGALGDATWAGLRAQGHPAATELEVSWRSPAYYHCNFTALPDIDPGYAGAWSEALYNMSLSDPSLRNAMQLEGVRQWRRADKAGYVHLTNAMREQGYLH